MSIYKKLLEVQKEVGAISRDSTNPFFKSKYFDINKLIEVVNPVLSKHGLVLMQPILDNKVYSEIVLADLTECEKGDTYIVQSYLDLPNIQDPQKLGIAITYYRRYTLGSLLGLQAEDEDGNGVKDQISKEEIEDYRVKVIGCQTKESLTNLWGLMPEHIQKIHKDLVAKTGSKLK